MIKYQVGNLILSALNGKFDVIAHGCNCFHTMGAGIAKQIKNNWPNAFRIDKLTSYGSKEKLGTYSEYYDIPLQLRILNCYTQFKYGKDINIDYDALKSCMDLIAINFQEKRVGLPWIGCGLAGGVQSKVHQIYEDSFKNSNIEVTVLTLI